MFSNLSHLSNAGTVLTQAKNLQKRWETRDIDPGYSMREFRQDITLVQDTIAILTQLNNLLQNSSTTKTEHEDIASKAMFFVNKLKKSDVQEKEMTSSNKSSLMDSIFGFIKNTKNDEVKRQLSSDMEDIKQYQNSNQQNPSQNYQTSNQQFQDQIPRQQYQDSSQQYQNTNQQYQNTNQQYQNTNQQYHNSEHHHHNANEQFQNPSQQYQNPNQQYQNSNQQYQNPNQQYQNSN